MIFRGKQQIRGFTVSKDESTCFSLEGGIGGGGYFLNYVYLIDIKRT